MQLYSVIYRMHKPGFPVISSLQGLGVHVITVDRYANAPRHQSAHHSYVIDMSDGDELAALIEREKPDLVIPEIEAIATAKLDELETADKITCIPTARAAMLTMNREGIRRLAAEELGLATSPYRFASSLDELTQACAGISPDTSTHTPAAAFTDKLMLAWTKKPQKLASNYCGPGHLRDAAFSYREVNSAVA